MLKITKQILILVLISSFGILQAQPWLNKKYTNKSRSEINFYDMQKAFNKWADGKDLSKTKGIKNYKRWEWFMSSRVYPSGELKNPSVNMVEWKKQEEKRESNYKSINTPNWVSISPVSLPVCSDTMNITGMGRVNSITFHPSDSSIFWVCTSQGGLWKTVNNGLSWVNLTDRLAVQRTSYLAVNPNNTDILYLATGDVERTYFGAFRDFGVGVLKSIDGGLTWSATGLSYELEDASQTFIRKIIINSNNTNEIIVAGYNGIFKSQDAGATWTQINNFKAIDLDQNFQDENTLFMSTYYDGNNANSKRIYRSYDFGTTWEELNTDIPTGSAVVRVEVALAPSDTNIVYAITAKEDNGGMHNIIKSIDGGTTWSELISSPNVLGWTDGGVITGNIPGAPTDDEGQGNYDLTLVVDPDDANKVYSGGVNMWGSADGGTTWDIVSMWVTVFGESVHADHHYSVFNPLTKDLYQTTDGGVYRCQDVKIGSWSEISGCIDLGAAMSGNYDDINDLIEPGCYTFPSVWEALNNGINNNEYYRLATCRTDENIIVGGTQDNGTFMYRDGEWLQTLGGDGMESMIDHYNSDIIYATNYSGALSKSIDGGLTYTQSIEQPITDAGETADWVAPYTMHPVNSDTIYAGFNNVWLSPDQGTTWNKISDFGSNAPLISVVVAPSGNTIYTASRTAIYRTTDAGENWSSIKAGLPTTNAAITYIAINENNPLELYTTFSGYEDSLKVFKSTNGGDTWENISSNLPNLPVNCIVYQNGTINNVTGGIYIGTDIGVYYTNDEIINNPIKWKSYDLGLPTVVVNELEIQYSAEKLRAATYGRGLWEANLNSPDYSNINDLASSTSNIFDVYPNPNNGNFEISLSQNISNQDFNVNIYTLTGIQVYSSKIATNNKKISVSGITKGVYIIQLTSSKSQFTSRITIQ